MRLTCYELDYLISVLPSLLEDSGLPCQKEVVGQLQDYQDVQGTGLSGCRDWFLAVVRGLPRSGELSKNG